MHHVRHPDEPIVRPDHPAVRRISALLEREERERTGLFFTEGMRFVAQALDSDTQIRQIVAAPELLTHPFSHELLRRARGAGIPILKLSAEVFLALSRAETPQGIGAVVRQRWETLRQIRPSESLCWVCLEAVRSPGNLGTILRTCDAVGAPGVILLGSTADPYDPAAVRATMGALFTRRVVRASFAELAAWKGRHRCRLVGTSPGAQLDYRQVSYREPVVLLMGSEQQGLSPEQQALCDAVVRIPMVGAGDSLNLAVATGVILYEVYNQRHAPPPRHRWSGARRRRRR